MAINFVTTEIPPITFQEYSDADSNLITSLGVDTVFDPKTDKIEYFIYQVPETLVISEYNLTSYRLENNDIIIDPEVNLTEYFLNEGTFNTTYNFVRPQLGSSVDRTYFISQISADRTEIRLDTTSIPNELVISSSQELVTNIQNSTGSYYDFYLNFGDNQLIIANNALLDTSNIDNPTVLIKLYEPLPPQFELNTQLWVVTQVAESVGYEVTVTETIEIESDTIYLKGPNFNLNVQDQINNSTSYYNYTNLSTTTSSYAQGTGSLQYQLNNILSQKGVQVNVDYSNYSNFIHFSSAQTRLENFYYKLQLLEEYTYSSSLSDGPSNASYYVSSSNIVWQRKIDEIITGFDNYENYLYYQSGSTSWPKTGNTPPYINVTTDSTSGLTWFASQSVVAEDYDTLNKDALIKAIPGYIIEDPDNASFELFVEMIGQMFDNVFVYLQSVTDKYDADNRLNYGVSKDLVADILRDMGIKIYQNNFSSNDLYQALIGITPEGNLYNLPFTTGSLPVTANSGLEYISTYITASATSSLIPTDDLNKSVYKRIYHNLPYLLKKKGTIAGLRALINVFGIPDTILRINEFGGKDKNINSYDNWQNTYDYKLDFNGSSSKAYAPWNSCNTTWGTTVSQIPSSFAFRFKTEEVTTAQGPTYPSQSLVAFLGNPTLLNNTNVLLSLTYSGSLSSGSYSGSVPNPYYQYGTLTLYPDYPNVTNTASIALPFYDGGWWSVLVNSGSAEIELIAKNKNYKGEDGNIIGFQSSASVVPTTANWSGGNSGFLILGATPAGSGLGWFTGSFQETRYYTYPLSQSAFDAFVMNPNSVEGNSIDEGPNQIIFRASLGGELYTSSYFAPNLSVATSIHPKITGSWITTASFQSGFSTMDIVSASFSSNTEVMYFDQVPAGIQNAISQKIKQQNIILPYSGSDSNVPSNTVLSPFISVQQFPSVSESYTRDIDYVEIAFSPQNEINEDINSSLGYFNIGEYIGDPRFQTSSLETYPDLDALSNSYFEKYTGNYFEWNYIRLIEFFNNSLFKMFQDWVPARASLASGIVIKNTLLDRNRYRVPQSTLSASVANIGSASVNIPWVVQDQIISGSITSSYITGSTGGTMPDLFGLTASTFTYPGAVNIDQVWYGSTPSLSGSVPFTQSSQTEFYDGELSGSNLVVTTGSLNNCQVSVIPVYSNLSYSEQVSGIGYGTLISVFPFKSDRSYFLSFVVENISIFTDSLIIYDSTDNAGNRRLLYQTPDITSGNNYAVVDIEIQNPVAPLYFAHSNALGTLQVDTLIIKEIYVDPDCKVIENDTQVSRPSSKYFDVDFTSNSIIAVNEQSILSGSATRATVPDSYYTTARIINPRYNGCELTTYASRSAAETYVEYFGYFDYIQFGGQSPAYSFGVSDVHLVALIDINGNSITLNEQNNNIGYVQNSFNSYPSISSSLATASIIFPGYTTGSFTSASLYPIIEGGGFVEVDGGGGYTRSLNEQSVAIDLFPTLNPFGTPNVTQSGLIIPGNFNPNFTGSFIKLAQQAGFFQTL